MTERPTRPLRLHGTIARKLGIAILAGEHAPGDLLESEIAASEQFEVSRTAYREAVRILAAKGLVDARPKVGTRIHAQPTPFGASRRADGSPRPGRGETTPCFTMCCAVEVQGITP
jgi:DNA-binding FadR family transcriptional regulator